VTFYATAMRCWAIEPLDLRCWHNIDIEQRTNAYTWDSIGVFHRSILGVTSLISTSSTSRGGDPLASRRTPSSRPASSPVTASPSTLCLLAW
jgi:hypothetical protein